MINLRILVLFAAIVQFGRVTASDAYRLEPISRVFSPTGSNATQSFEIVNNESERIAITVSVMTLERDENYVETNKDAEDDFLLYPAQLILSPGKSQTLRVTWLGPTNPKRELTYRLIVQQVPIELLDPKASPTPQLQGRVRVLLAYRGTLFIRPENAQPKIAIEAGPVSEKEKTLVLTLVNRGTAVGLVKRCTIRLETALGASIDVPASALDVMSNDRVLAGGRRRYQIPWPTGLAPQAVKATGRCIVES